MKLYVLIPIPGKNKGELRNEPCFLIEENNWLAHQGQYYNVILSSGMYSAVCPDSYNIYSFGEGAVLNAIIDELNSRPVIADYRGLYEARQRQTDLEAVNLRLTKEMNTTTQLRKELMEARAKLATIADAIRSLP